MDCIRKQRISNVSVPIMTSLFVMMLISVSSYFQSYPKESQYAIDFASMHKSEIINIKNHLTSNDARLAMCIVAPEVSRHSQLSDAAETYALYTLYVQGRVSDFSIGAFQMKPSFAVSIEEEVAKCDYLKQYRKLIINESSARLARCERVNRLSSLDWQLVYLCAFVEIARTRTTNMSFSDIEEKLRYWATLYNAGLYSSESKIYTLYDIDGFPKFSSCSFNYADISIEFYRNKKFCSYL